jgi:hypothetical protein
LWLHDGDPELHCPDKHEPSPLPDTEPRRCVVMLEEEAKRAHIGEGQSLHHWVRGRWKSPTSAGQRDPQAPKAGGPSGRSSRSTGTATVKLAAKSRLRHNVWAGGSAPPVCADKTSRSSAQTHPLLLLLSSLHNTKSRTRTTANGSTHPPTSAHNGSRRVRPALHHVVTSISSTAHSM